MPDLVRELRHELMSVGLHGDVETHGLVSDAILRSWRRSISVHVPRDVPTERFSEVDSDSPLCRAAAPIFDRWQNQLSDTGTALLLSDRGGSIVMRRPSDSGLRRRLDKAHAAEGFNFSEDAAGTNGLGTAIAERGAIYIAGSEHFSELLSDVTCAAVPITAPGGSVIGAVSISASRKSANPLLLSLTREIGQQIEERLRSTARPEDLAMAMTFMRYSNSERPVVVMNRESLLANTPGLNFVDMPTQIMLWNLLTAHDWSQDRVAYFAYGEGRINVTAARIVSGAGEHFVLQFESSHIEDALSRTHELSVGSTAVVTPRKYGVASPVLLAEGRVGTGRATGLRRDLESDCIDLDASNGIDTWETLDYVLAAGTSLLIRNIDLLPESQSEALGLLLDTHVNASRERERSSQVLLTWDPERAPAEIVRVVAVAQRTMSLRPLAETPERVPALVKEILEGLDTDRRRSISPAALQALMEWSWPGNIVELRDLLESLISSVHDSVIQRKHLPGYITHAGASRHFTLLEDAERQAILRALEVTNGNKSDTAKLLGIGRTTLYRRLRYFKLDHSEGSL